MGAIAFWHSEARSCWYSFDRLIPFSVQLGCESSRKKVALPPSVRLLEGAFSLHTPLYLHAAYLLWTACLAIGDLRRVTRLSPLFLKILVDPRC